MIRAALITMACLVAFGDADAGCGERGGPGYRGPHGKCVGWAELGRTCGTPPTSRCTAESVATNSDTAAIHGVKAWEAGREARQAVGRAN